MFILKTKLEYKLLFLLILISILMRSVNFSYHLNFSTDQADFSSKILDIVNYKEPVLIGPRFSFIYDGRYMFQGPLIYYFQMVFLILGGFEPILSSYFFMLFSCLMIIPLYYGVKGLTNEKIAVLMILIYAFLPYYIDYSRFFWNPNFQFVLSPILIYLIARFKMKPTKINFLLISIFTGALLHFHYSFLIVILGLLVYLFIFSRVPIYYLIIFLGGILLSFIPLIVFEFRNNFYNLNTLMLFIQHKDVVFPKINTPPQQNPHYYITMSFFSLLLLFILIKKAIQKIKFEILIFFGVILPICDLLIYLPKPENGFRMAYRWNYLDEQKVSNIIINDKKKNFNVMNLAYDTLASVQKYNLKRMGILIDESNYYSNDYLYIITDRENFMNDPAYEIKNFKPYVIEQSWVVDDTYKLHRVKRLKT